VNNSVLAPNDICRAIDQLAIRQDYACFAGRLVGTDDPRPSVPADALLNLSMRTAIEARFSQRFDNFDPRAVHSIWMKWYLNAFLPPVLLADLLYQSVEGLTLWGIPKSAGP
jgi:ferric iron reductase protein FhuF